jgi:hypothetical protein
VPGLSRGSLRQRGHPYCELSHSAAQSLGDATSTTLTYNTVEQDNLGSRDTNNQTRLYCSPGQGGLYRAWVWAQFAGDADGARQVWFIKNGVTGTTYGDAGVPSIGAVTATKVQTEWLFELVTGDYLEARGRHDAGGALDVSATRFKLEYLGMPQ